MPEGPEVRRQAERLAKARVGRPLAEVWFEPARLKTWEAPLRAAGVAAITTRGKADPEGVAAGKAAGLPRGAWRHFAFGREGKRCPRCGGDIARVELAGRRVYVCACQRAERR